MNLLCIFDAIVHHARFHINNAVIRRRAEVNYTGVPALQPTSQLALPEEIDVPVVFTGADLRYLQLYGPSLIKGIAHVSHRLRVHIHIMLLEGENCEPELRELKSLLPAGRLTFSTEVCEAPPATRHERAQFFQVRRFARLAEFVSLNSFDVMALDIDTVFLKSPEFVVGEWPNHDLLVQVNLGPFRPTPFTCAFVWLRPTDRVRRMLMQASQKMQQHASTGFKLDHIDERCFANEVYSLLNFEIVALPDDFCSTSPESSYVFDGVGDEKNRIGSILSLSAKTEITREEVSRFRQGCCVGQLRPIHFRKAWNSSSFSILWRRILE